MEPQAERQQALLKGKRAKKPETSLGGIKGLAKVMLTGLLIQIHKKDKRMFRSTVLVGIVLLFSACSPADDFTQQKIAARRAAA